jgi:hypothetical protein
LSATERMLIALGGGEVNSSRLVSYAAAIAAMRISTLEVGYGSLVVLIRKNRVTCM